MVKSSNLLFLVLAVATLTSSVSAMQSWVKLNSKALQAYQPMNDTVTVFPGTDFGSGMSPFPGSIYDSSTEMNMALYDPHIICQPFGHYTYAVIIGKLYCIGAGFGTIEQLDIQKTAQFDANIELNHTVNIGKFPPTILNVNKNYLWNSLGTPSRYMVFDLATEKLIQNVSGIQCNGHELQEALPIADGTYFISINKTNTSICYYDYTKKTTKLLKTIPAWATGKKFGTGTRLYEFNNGSTVVVQQFPFQSGQYEIFTVFSYDEESALSTKTYKYPNVLQTNFFQVSDTVFAMTLKNADGSYSISFNNITMKAEIQQLKSLAMVGNTTDVYFALDYAKKNIFVQMQDSYLVIDKATLAITQVHQAADSMIVPITNTTQGVMEVSNYGVTFYSDFNLTKMTKHTQFFASLAYQDKANNMLYLMNARYYVSANPGCQVLEFNLSSNAEKIYNYTSFDCRLNKTEIPQFLIVKQANASTKPDVVFGQVKGEIELIVDGEIGGVKVGSISFLSNSYPVPFMDFANKTLALYYQTNDLATKEMINLTSGKQISQKSNITINHMIKADEEVLVCRNAEGTMIAEKVFTGDIIMTAARPLYDYTNDKIASGIDMGIGYNKSLPYRIEWVMYPKGGKKQISDPSDKFTLQTVYAFNLKNATVAKVDLPLAEYSCSSSLVVGGSDEYMSCLTFGGGKNYNGARTKVYGLQASDLAKLKPIPQSAGRLMFAGIAALIGAVMMMVMM